MPNCPCCSSSQGIHNVDPMPHYCCLGCGHRWHAHNACHAIDYTKLRYRNPIEDVSHMRKLRDRMADISPLLQSGMRILEIGCAEGSLGAMIRDSVPVHYTGIELSEDAMAAGNVLDRVLRVPASEISADTFDLIMSFHVLEHVKDIAGEVAHWHRLLATAGKLLIEVPNQSGHYLLSFDSNQEHIHQFTPASLTALLQYAGFEIERLDTGHWESSVYSDSLRVIARPAVGHAQRREFLLQRFKTRLPKPFAAWGIGGDFHGYVEPLLDSLPVAALIDSAPQRHGERHGNIAVEGYDPLRHGTLPILICSVRYREAIQNDLDALGIPPQRIVSLDDIYGGAT